MNHFKNYAGKHCDSEVRKELDDAGIPAQNTPEFMRGKTGTKEVNTIVVGDYLGWWFERGWAYWIATGPGIPYDLAKSLNDRHGDTVRIDGYSGGRDVDELLGFGIGLYHIDTEEGLKALKETLDEVHARFVEMKKVENSQCS